MNRLLLVALFVIAPFVFACSAAPPRDEMDAGVDAGLQDAGPIVDAGEDAGFCPTASHPSGDGGCESTVTWSEGPALPFGIHHHVSFVSASDAGTWVYLAGGANSWTAFNYSIARALVEEDGSLAEWEPATSLPKSLVGSAVALVDNTVVITGGYTSSSTLSTATYLSIIHPDGTLEPWQTGPAIPTGRMHHVTVSVGEFVYLVGGSSSSGPLGTVHRARVIDSGTLEAWQEIGSLPEPRSHHSIAVSGRFLFLTGGETTGAVERERDVLRARVLEDGQLDGWTRVGELPVRLLVHASFVRQGWLYVVGGVKNGSEPSAEMFRARLSEDGTIGEWEPALNALPFARAHVHQTPIVDDRFIYSFGGMIADDGTSTPQVSVGRFE